MPALKRKRTNDVRPKRFTSKSLSFSRGPSWSLESGVNMPGLGAMPVSFKTTLRYRDQLITLNPGAAGIAASHVWSANGLYDPDITGTGHQPAGFDQLMLFYNHYTVTHAKITVTFANQDTTNGQTVAIFIADTDTTYSDIRQPIENGNCTFSELNLKNNSPDQKTLTANVDIRKFMARKSVMDDPTLYGTSSGNPTDQVYFILTAAPQAVTDSSNIGCQTTIEYNVVFTERKRVAIS